LSLDFGSVAEEPVDTNDQAIVGDCGGVESLEQGSSRR
jgi:hypothetical protein